MQKRKKLVYLDQNFASNLAKARYLEGWKDRLADFYRGLNNLLFNLTDRDRVICPTSPFHTEETELGQRVRDFAWHFVEQLGYGLSFKGSYEIKNHQVITAARAYCCLPPIQYPIWMDAFNRDPQVPVRQIQRPAFLVSIPNSQEFYKYLRLSKASIAGEY
jgi:hypothetical protein